ncbi:hypothetical protein STCU_10505 [Strigomonas culicis]|uniref:Uncharacterized protein n=1 Tax=Strigomonas culicis TaxID=28005 RepID=S9V455_9TRYP|nr:hypothetical protein STCU_10505 [Strigomonas culicis]|eukprot:EPY17615.1 hypothetical protein STCU_10505 [Strigomonas culicis]
MHPNFTNVTFASNEPGAFDVVLTLDRKVPAEEAATQTEEEAAEANRKTVLKLSLDNHALSPIPASARACAAVWLDVVIPPARANSNYDFFYKRVQETESEHERVAIARIIAQHAPMWLFAGLDFLVRMFTGHQSEFTFSKKHARMIGVPESIAEHPPVQRKLLLMYMDAAKQWVLSDLIAVRNTYAGLRETEQTSADA